MQRRRGGPADTGKRRPSRGAISRVVPSAGWDHVASWYDRLVGDDGSDYHRNVIIPAALQMLAPQKGERFLDVCCGQGVFCRALLGAGAGFVMGVDASQQLIAAAQRREGGGREAGGAGAAKFLVRDARRLADLGQPPFDGAACLMAVQDLDDVGGLFAGMAAALRAGGRAVVIMMHPCFRVPRQSSWGWDEQRKLQYRRVDRYASPLEVPISTRPGDAPDVHTTFHHRPLADYVNAMGKAGLAIVECRELLTHRQSTTGGKARGENRAATEIPIFLALRALRAGNVEQDR